MPRSRTATGPGHADFTYEAKYGIRDWRGSGRASARETADARRRRRHRPQGRARHDRARRAGPDRPARHRPHALGLGRGRPQPVLLPRRRDGRPSGPTISTTSASAARRSAPSSRSIADGAAGRPRRADLRQARPGHRLGADVDQRGQGRRDRRRLRRRAPHRRGERRRDAHRATTAARSSCRTMPAASSAASRPASRSSSVSRSSRPRRSSTRAAPINRAGEEVEVSTKGRHDPCVGIRAVPIGEAMLAIVLADHYLRHRGQVG